MLKLKNLINVLVAVTILFCLPPINNSIAGDCDNKGAGEGTQTVSGNYIYPPGYECTEDPDLIYDTVNSAETIDRNGSAALVVIGNNGPFIWSVSGTGFTLENEGQPTGPTNTLYADGLACGAATITVTGCDGKEVKGFVRCTTGQWGPTQDGCVLSGSWDSISCGYGWPHYYCDYEKTGGKYTQSQRVISLWTEPVGDQTTCLTPVNCSDILGPAWENGGEWMCCAYGDCEHVQNIRILYNLWLNYREWTCN